MKETNSGAKARHRSREEAGCPRFAPVIGANLGIGTMQVDMHYRARYYEPSIGRFISEDPVGVDGGINFYVYTNNNPINFNDPLGLSPSNNGPTIGPANPNDKPNVPPTWSYCSAYRDGTGAGDALYHLCMNFPDGPWSNCVRGKLLKQYVPNGNPLQLGYYLFLDHPIDFAACRCK